MDRPYDKLDSDDIYVRYENPGYGAQYYTLLRDHPNHPETHYVGVRNAGWMDQRALRKDLCRPIDIDEFEACYIPPANPKENYE